MTPLGFLLIGAGVVFAIVVFISISRFRHGSATATLARRNKRK